MPHWLDRFWLAIIAVAFVIAVPLWLLLMSNRYGWRFTVGGVALALFWRYRSSLK